MKLYKIIQDEKGYIWIGTEAGLVRFDGYDFSVLTTRDGLPNNDIIYIEEDALGKIWISSIGPLCYWEEGEIIQIDKFRPNHSALGFDLAALPNGDVWLNRGREIFYYRPESGLLAHQLALNDDYFAINRFAQQRADTVWIFRNDVFTQVSGRHLLTEYRPIIKPNLTKRFYMMFHNDRIYYTSTEGLVTYHIQTKEEKLVVPGIDQVDQLLIHNDKLIVVDHTQSLKVYKMGPNGDLIFEEQFFEGLNPNSAIVDQEGNLWVTTFGHGLYFLASQSVDYKDLSAVLPEPDLGMSCVEVIDGQLTVSADDGRVWRFDSTLSQAEVIFRDTMNRSVNRIRDIKKDPEGNLYLAGEYGMFRCNEDGCVSLSRLTIKQMTTDENGDFLLATNVGVIKVPYQNLQQGQGVIVDRYNNRAYNKLAQQLSTTRSYTVFAKAEDEIWMDDVVNGLTQYAANGDTVYWASKSSIFYLQAKEIISWQDSIIVVATHGEGVILIKGSEYLQINSMVGMPSDICNAFLVEDEQLWVATNKGLAVLSDINWEDRLFSIETIDHNDGLLTDHIEDMAMFKDKIALATSRGIILLDKQLSATNKIAPLVYLNAVEVNNQSYPVDTSLYLTHQENNITFYFTALSYLSMGEIKYRYRMLGLDDNWSYSRSRELRFVDLKPGNYTFELIAVSKSGQESQQPLRYSFSINPSFFQQPLFLVLALLVTLLLAVGVGYTLNTFRQRAELQELVEEKTVILNEQVKELANANSRLEISNNELEQFARVASHDLKSPLRNVASFVQLLERRAKEKLNKEELEYIQLAVEGTRSMERVINDLLKMSSIDEEGVHRELVSFRTMAEKIFREHQSLVTAKNARLIFDTPLPELFMSAVNAQQLLQNLIVNGLTYNERERAEIHVGYESMPGYWRFYVRDNGIGIAEAYQEKVFTLFQRLHSSTDYPGTGIGLAICKKIVERNGGRIWFRSEENQGTTFYFTLAQEKVRAPTEELHLAKRNE